jgi:anti-sigma regulatory factor (Ser/Thr protein kinase)
MKKNLEEKVPDKIIQPAVADSIPSLVEFVAAQVYETGMEDAKIHAIKLGMEEVLQNIIEFACLEGTEEITISCEALDSGAMLIHIWDTGKPFNMLLAGTFPEVEEIAKHEKIPSTKMLKKAVKNIEYIRGTNKNILILTIPPVKGKI